MTAAAPELCRLATLSAGVDAADQAVTSARVSLDERKSRRSDLDARLTALRASEPKPSSEFDDALLEAVAADPAHAPDAAVMAEASARHAAEQASLDGWRRNVSLIEQAIARLDAEIAYAGDSLAQQEAARDRDWRAFVIGAQTHLVGQFRVEFARLLTDLIEPALALAEQTDSARNRICSAAVPRFDAGRSSVFASFVDPATGRINHDRMFPPRTSPTSADHARVLKDFRARLAEG